MIDYKTFTLQNGLQVVVHEVPHCKTAVLNIMYNVGARDEHPDRTGFAHLFEHLMFSGSINIPAYDEALQQVGGENNAYTTNDVTNYYCSLPAVNLETAFWLESDRMLGLAFNKEGLEVQRKVVIEEFKQNYLNTPYGDAWIKLCALSYQKHPYQWPTIGKEIAPIEQATMEEVKAFFKKFYMPNNAILVVAGDVEYEEVKRLSEKWFGPIPAGKKYQRALPQEPAQKEARTETTSNNVPLKAMYKTYHMPARLDKQFSATELLADLLGHGHSSLLYEELVHHQKVFTSIGASTTGSFDPGLLIIHGTLNEGITFEEADSRIQATIDYVQNGPISTKQLEKIKNQAEAYIVKSNMSLLHKAEILAEATLLGDTELVNHELAHLQSVTVEAIQHQANTLLQSEQSNTLYYDVNQ